MSYGSSNISILITSYNQKRYLVEAIESALHQSLPPLEIIISDDNSTDGSQEIIEHYRAKYPDLVIPFLQKKNLGISNNRNFLINKAQGRFITFLDGDDRFLPNKLLSEYQALLKNHNCQFVFSNVYYINESGSRTGCWLKGTRSKIDNVFLKTFSRSFPKNQLFRNELVDIQCVKEIGNYDPKFSLYEDWDFKIRLTKHFKACYCPEALVEYRRHKMNISNASFLKHYECMHAIYKNYQNLLNDLAPEIAYRTKKKLFSVLSAKALAAFVHSLEGHHHEEATEIYSIIKRYGSPFMQLALICLRLLPARLFRLFLLGYRDIKAIQGVFVK